jgi:hypothetical protein
MRTQTDKAGRQGRQTRQADKAGRQMHTPLSLGPPTERPPVPGAKKTAPTAAWQKLCEQRNAAPARAQSSWGHGSRGGLH